MQNEASAGLAANFISTDAPWKTRVHHQNLAEFSPELQEQLIGLRDAFLDT